MHSSYLTPHLHLRSIAPRQSPCVWRPLRRGATRCEARREAEYVTLPEEAPRPVSSLKTAAAACAFVLSGVGNRVTYKMALVPMRDYIFFMAQMLSVVYICFYIPVLLVRYRMGKVTNEMLAIPKLRFLVTGGCEAGATLLLAICASRLPGVILPIISQLILIWQLVLSVLLLGKKYSRMQLVGVVFVVLGSILCGTAISSSGAAGEASVPYLLLINVAFILYALSFVTKEKIFADSKKLLGGKDLDIFVVNSFGSIAQFFCSFCLLPWLLQAKQMTFQELPHYMAESVSCLGGTSLSGVSDCSGAPLLPLMYVCANLALNMNGLYLIRTIGAVVTSICNSLIVPASVIVFSLPLPYLDSVSSLSVRFVMGCTTLVTGMLIYSSRDILALAKSKQA